MEEAERSFPDFPGRICFVGHSHLPVFFIQDGKGECREARGTRIQIESGSRYMVNVGSVGQPRDGNPNGSYLLFDGQEGRMEIKRVPYDLHRTQKKMAEAGLPRDLAARLAAGR